MKDYVILTDATADHVEDILNDYPFLDIIPMIVTMDNVEYSYGGKESELSCEDFYELERNGVYGSTSAISPGVYYQYFEQYLQQGFDIIYLCFSSGMSSTYQTACLVAEDLEGSYPGQRVVCIDTLNGSTPQGFLVHEAANKKKDGFSFEELVNWVEENKLNVGVCFSVNTLDFLAHGGRLSRTSAIIGDSLRIKPILRIDQEGKLEVIAKPLGKQNALHYLVDRLTQGWTPEKGKKVLICHGDDLEVAEKLQKMVQDACPEAEIEIGFIDPIIGVHTGPGMVSIVYWGTNR